MMRLYNIGGRAALETDGGTVDVEQASGEPSGQIRKTSMSNGMSYDSGLQTISVV